jgi:hypothetical protein
MSESNRSDRDADAPDPMELPATRWLFVKLDPTQ